MSYVKEKQHEWYLKNKERVRENKRRYLENMTPEKRVEYLAHKREKALLKRVKKSGCSSIEEYKQKKKELWLESIAKKRGYADIEEMRKAGEERKKAKEKEYNKKYKEKLKQKKCEALGISVEEYEERKRKQKLENFKKGWEKRKESKVVEEEKIPVIKTVEEQWKEKGITPPYISAGITKAEYYEWLKRLASL